MIVCQNRVKQKLVTSRRIFQDNKLSLYMTAERPVGLFRGKAGRKVVAQRSLTRSETMVMSREFAVTEAQPYDKMWYFIPVIGSKAAKAVYLGTGNMVLASEGRVEARLRHTAIDPIQRLEMGAMFGRLKINSLNLNGELPWVEKLLLMAQTSKDVEALGTLPIVGGAIKIGQGVLTPFLKLITRDSWRAKGISFIGNPLLGAIGGAFSESVIAEYVAPWVSSGKFENGLDAGDQIADLATFAGYLEFMQNPHVSESRKKRIARAFIDHYDRPPTNGQVKRHEKGLRRNKVLDASHDTLEAGHKVVREVEQFVQIPFSGVLAGATKLTRGSDAANPPRSMHETVDKVLEVAPLNIARLQATIAADKGVIRRVGIVDAEVALATWKYRLEVAALLNSIYQEARVNEPLHASKFIPEPRRGRN